MSNEAVFIVRTDKQAFLNSVKSLVDPLLVEQINQGATAVLALKYPEDFKVPELWSSFAKVQRLIAVICSAIEVTKTQFIVDSNVPNAKFDKALALETAVKIIDEYIVFEGWLGSIIDKIDGPVLNILISMYVSGKSANWLVEAKQILGL